MKRKHFIALDTHCEFCELAAATEAGPVKWRERCATTIPALVEAVEKVPSTRHLVVEEGPIADWLFRNLAGHVDELVVCDPRRNHLIAKDSDKDDAIDAEKLLELFRGGYTKPVHHPESFDRVVFKQHVGLYHDRVRQRVREANRIMSQFRRHGVFIREAQFVAAASRPALVERLPKHQVVRSDIELLWKGYDVVCEQVEALRKSLERLSRGEPQVRRFTELPGVGWIRAATFFTCVDTPWRFRAKAALWRYLGIGLERRHSGSGPVQLRVPHAVNRTLKCVILGAAMSAVASGSNPFADQHERWLADGISPRNARRNVARSLAAVLWGMWKTGGAYRPEWVGVAAASALERCSN